MTGKSILAVAAGIIFVLVVTTLVDILLHAVHVFPPLNQAIDDRLAAIATSYRVVIGIAGAWLTAWLAPDRPMRHAMWGGYLGVVLGLIGVVTTWNLGLGPHWYPIALAALAIPQAWVGGTIGEKARAA